MNDEIKIIRGTTNIFDLVIFDNSEQAYELKDGDKIVFGVKKNPESANYDIKKIITAKVSNVGNITIKLSPEDTQKLPFGRYYFDVGLQTSEGNYYMVIPFSTFIVGKAITQKE